MEPQDNLRPWYGGRFLRGAPRGVYIVYGLCFLALGLVVAVRLPRLSRFDLTDAFILLAAFGFTGAGLSALALIYWRMHRAGLQRPEPAILVMAIAFAAYAVFPGLIPTYQLSFTEVPTPVFRATCALVIAGSGARTMTYLHDLFRSNEPRVDTMEPTGHSAEEFRAGLLALMRTLRELIGGSAVTIFSWPWRTTTGSTTQTSKRTGQCPSLGWETRRGSPATS